MNYLSQLGGQGDLVSTIVWFLLFFVMMFFYPKLMTSQTIWKLEKDAAELEGMAAESTNMIIEKITKKPTKELKASIGSFMEFFAVFPDSTDPYGIIKKMDMVIKQSDLRFRQFVDQIVPNASEAEKSNIKDAFGGAITTYQIAKIVRHYLETIKKYKILQLAMILQMQIPMIKDLAKSAKAATNAFVNGIPIGDSIGPMVAAELTQNDSKVHVYNDEEFSLVKTKVAGKNVLISKANGPGATVGYPGKFLIKAYKKHKFKRILTIDAGMRFEGEKSGSVAEGVGVAMGGAVERFEIEEFTLSKKIPLDAIIIKVNQEEALEPMQKQVMESVPEAIERVKQMLKRYSGNDLTLVMGVGNTCGVGPKKKDAEKAKEELRSWHKKHPKVKKKEGWF